MITFTGSTSVGKRISQLNPLIPVSLELGGKDAAIVLKDADIAKTAENIVKGAFLGAGSINEPENNYHLEINFQNQEYANYILNICKKYIHSWRKICIYL